MFFFFYANVWSSITFECSYWEEKCIRKYNEVFFTDVAFLSFELWHVRAKMVELEIASKEMKAEVEASVGLVQAQRETEVEEVRVLREDLEALRKKSEGQSLCYSQLYEIKQKIEIEAEKVPHLKAELKKKSEECDKLLKEKAELYTPEQCQDQYWVGICGARRIFAKNMPEFD